MSVLRFVTDDAPLRSAMDGLGRSLSRGFPKQAARADKIAAEGLRLAFREGRAPDGSRWTAPKAETLARRKVKKTPPALTDTGELGESLFGDAAAAYAVRLVGPGGFFRGTDRIDARAHDQGFEATNLPARPFADVSSEDEGRMLDVIEAEVARRGALTRRGLI